MTVVEHENPSGQNDFPQEETSDSEKEIRINNEYWREFTVDWDNDGILERINRDRLKEWNTGKLTSLLDRIDDGDLIPVAQSTSSEAAYLMREILVMINNPRRNWKKVERDNAFNLGKYCQLIENVEEVMTELERRLIGEGKMQEYEAGTLLVSDVFSHLKFGNVPTIGHS